MRQGYQKGNQMTDKIGRRGFLGTVASAALEVPLASRPGRAQGQSTAKVRRIAVEEHWTAEDVSAALKRPVRAAENEIGEKRIAAMDAAGIAMQVINNSSCTNITDAPTAVRLVKNNNDYLAEVVRKYPGRFA